MQTLILLLITIAANVLANLFLKFGADKLPHLELAKLPQNIVAILSNGWILLGAFFFITNFPLYNMVLQRMKLSVAFPLITASTFLLTVLISVVFLKEHLSIPQYVGIGLLIVGIGLVSAT